MFDFLRHVRERISSGVCAVYVMQCVGVQPSSCVHSCFCFATWGTIGTPMHEPQGQQISNSKLLPLCLVFLGVPLKCSSPLAPMKLAEPDPVSKKTKLYPTDFLRCFISWQLRLEEHYRKGFRKEMNDAVSTEIGSIPFANLSTCSCPRNFGGAELGNLGPLIIFNRRCVLGLSDFSTLLAWRNGSINGFTLDLDLFPCVAWTMWNYYRQFQNLIHYPEL